MKDQLIKFERDVISDDWLLARSHHTQMCGYQVNRYFDIPSHVKTVFFKVSAKPMLGSYRVQKPNLHGPIQFLEFPRRIGGGFESHTMYYEMDSFIKRRIGTGVFYVRVEYYV